MCVCFGVAGAFYSKTTDGFQGKKTKVYVSSTRVDCKNDTKSSCKLKKIPPSFPQAAMAFVYDTVLGPVLTPPFRSFICSKRSTALLGSPPTTHAIIAQLYSCVVFDKLCEKNVRVWWGDVQTEAFLRKGDGNCNEFSLRKNRRDGFPRCPPDDRHPIFNKKTKKTTTSVCLSPVKYAIRRRRRRETKG